MRYIFLILLLLMSGCEQKLKIRTDQIIYEKVLAVIHRNSIDKIYVDEVSESNWFKKNDLTELRKNAEIKKFDVIAPGLLEVLFEENKKTSYINWKPLFLNLQFDQFDKDSINESDKICLVPIGRGNINLEKGGQEYRAFYQFSKVAISSDGSRALLYFSLNCAPINGQGDGLVLLKKIDAEWVIEKSLRLKVS